MSQPSRPKAQGPARRRRSQWKFEAIQQLEARPLMAPIVATNNLTATFTAATTPTNTNLGTVTVTQGAAIATSAAAYTSVAQLAPISEFGGDIVRIEAGPGGDFGKGVYAISRGAGENTGAINKPGVIYRVDPATGKASIFFDLNSVISQIEPGGTAANSAGAATGLVNWYDIAFDTEGYFDGRTSMFVTSVDQADPNKNVIFRIAPDGTFLGEFVKFTATTTGQFVRQPSAISVPPPEQQTFLRGLVAGDASTQTGYVALAFNGNAFNQGTDLNSVSNLPSGVTPTGFTLGPQVGITPANSDYISNEYAVFTNFGTPAAGGLPAQPGLSGVQGIRGDLLINKGTPIVSSYNSTTFTTTDAAAAILTPFRRFQDTAFDQYGYFSYGTTLTAGTAGARPTVGTPAYAGSLFVADLATGLSVNVTPLAPLPTTVIHVPIQGGGGPIGVTTDGSGNVVPVFTNGSTTGGNLGGRIVRIDPNGVVTTFALGFHTSGRQDSQSFIDSSLSISFSADGTTLYASDDDGIWQFKSVASLAGSTSGSLVGLNDLRSLGVPYEGQNSSVAIVDRGVDALTPPLRGRVATGTNVLTNGPGNDDLAAGTAATTGTALTGVGHGTPVAGVVAQFVPQATLDPVNVFTPFQVAPAPGTLTTTATTAQAVYNGMNYLTKNPFAKDPVRPNKVDRVVAANFGFGTQASYPTEGAVYKQYPQIVIALKNQLHRFRQLGIAPVAAAGQFGIPGGNTPTTTTTTTGGDVNGMALPAILNEAISVTGSYSFPFTGTATTAPTDPVQGITPRPPGPVLAVGNNVAGGGVDVQGNAATLTAGDLLVFSDKILSSVNRTFTTDFTAPAVNVPTFSATATANGFVHNVFQQGGTSLSSAMVSGSFALVSSALDYWNTISTTGVTSDAYLTQPVGAHTLNYGPNQLINLSAYANPDGVNAILQWTAVPAVDQPNTLENVVLPQNLIGSTAYPHYSRISVSNAIAAIEGSIALDYLLKNHIFDIIDTNKDGLITAAKLQYFEDNAASMGLPEAGAMARFLGGTARIPTTGFQSTAVGENPDQPDVLQRRFNFFDYAANGQLQGVISIDALRMLSKRLLPAPDAFVINNRQHASNTGWLLYPQPQRNYADLQHLLPTYAFVPKRVVAKFVNASPAKFHVGRNVFPNTTVPSFTLFGPQSGKAKSSAKHNTAAKSGGGSTNSASGSGGGGASSSGGGTTGSTSTPQQSTPGTNNTTNAQTQADYQQSLLNAVKNAAQGSKGTTTPSTTSNGTGLSAQRPANSTGSPAATSAGGVAGTATDTGTVHTQVLADRSPVQSDTKATTVKHSAGTQHARSTSAAHHAGARVPTKQAGVFDYFSKWFKKH